MSYPFGLGQATSYVLFCKLAVTLIRWPAHTQGAKALVRTEGFKPSTRVFSLAFAMMFSFKVNDLKVSFLRIISLRTFSEYFCGMWYISDTEVEAVKEWFLRIYGTIFAFLFGWGALIAVESRTKKLSIREKWTSFFIAAFVAFIADGVLTHFGVIQLRGVLVGIATLGSNGIVVWILGNNTRILNLAFSIFLKNKGISESEPEEKKDDTVDKSS